MSVQVPSELTIQLEKVSQSLAQWRNQGRSRRRIPNEIWEQAAQLAAVYGVSPVAKELLLNHSKLKSMLPSKGEDEQSLVARAQHSPIPTAFLELLAPTQACKALGQCLLSLESTQGSRMRVEINSLEISDLVILIREFAN